jgi:predicted transcriptional regulator
VNINIISVIDGRRNLEEILYKKIINGKSITAGQALRYLSPSCPA